MWRRDDPREAFVDCGHKSIIIVRPHPRGHGWLTGTGHVEVDHGWYIVTSFQYEGPGLIDDYAKWDADWYWAEAPPWGRLIFPSFETDPIK